MEEDGRPNREPGAFIADSVLDGTHGLISKTNITVIIQMQTRLLLWFSYNQI